MSESPLFSIVIPTYNRSDLVEGAVRSVVRQTCPDFEVVVSDNCSEDNTREVVEEIGDPRVRYVRTPSHGVIADSWEFARAQARGRLIMMLSDDDALVPNALFRFAEEYRRHRSDFLFCNLAEYRDPSFQGPEENTVACRPFSGQTRQVALDEFLGPLFAFRPRFDMHPSAFMFAARIAEQVVQRSGRFFRTNGVEYFAWPLAAVLANSIVYIDAPLVILGRTAKSWGATVVLSNPGKQQIQKMIADAAQDRPWLPLTNFTLTNLMAEGMLLGRQMFPDELSAFPFDEPHYLRMTMRELRSRQAMGVDVDAEMRELVAYATKYPSLKDELLAPAPNGHRSTLREFAKALGLGRVRGRLAALREARRIRRGQVGNGFYASGRDFGFNDALSCSDFVARVTRN
jgi:glycosyltransferase involved in cell wall biosynthesis